MKALDKIKMMGVAAALMAAGCCAAVAVPTQAKYVCESGENAGMTVESKDDCTGASTSTPLMTTLTTIINVIIAIVGFVAVVVIILGGIFYTTSTGDSAKVKKAKDTIMYGIIGLVIALLAFAIVNFVLTSVFPAS